MTFAWGSTYVNFLRKEKNNLETLAPLLTTGVICKCMAEKAASSCLTYQHLPLVFERDGEFGLNTLLSEKFNGVVRVTKRKTIITQLINYFNSK